MIKHNCLIVLPGWVSWSCGQKFLRSKFQSNRGQRVKIIHDLKLCLSLTTKFDHKMLTLTIIGPLTMAMEQISECHRSLLWSVPYPYTSLLRKFLSSKCHGKYGLIGLNIQVRV